MALAPTPNIPSRKVELEDDIEETDQTCDPETLLSDVGNAVKPSKEINGLNTERTLIETHVFPMVAQGNIYTQCVVPGLEESTKKILAASLCKPLNIMEFVQQPVGGSPSKEQNVVANSRELGLSFIPNQAEIHSLDTFVRSGNKDTYVIGITLGKLPLPNDLDAFETPHNERTVPNISLSSEDLQRPDSAFQYYFNIYSNFGEDIMVEREKEDKTTDSLSNLSLSCSTIDLDFCPYMLTHVEIPLILPPLCHIPITETVWILAGSDERLHVYVEDRERITYKEATLSTHLPDLDNLNLSSPPYWIDIAYLDDSMKSRISCVGTECGSLTVTLAALSIEGIEIVQRWHGFASMGPVNTAKFFRLKEDPVNYLNRPAVLDKYFPPPKLFAEGNSEDADQEEMTPTSLQLLVVSALGKSLVFHDVAQQGLRNVKELPYSDQFDAVNSGVPIDLTMDGLKEIALGTFGQKLLVYSFDEHLSEWRMLWKRAFSDPLIKLDAADLFGDGCQELIVMSNRAVLILQNETESIYNLRRQRFLKFLSKYNDE